MDQTGKYIRLFRSLNFGNSYPLLKEHKPQLNLKEASEVWRLMEEFLEHTLSP